MGTFLSPIPHCYRGSAGGHRKIAHCWVPVGIVPRERELRSQGLRRGAEILVASLSTARRKPHDGERKEGAFYLPGNRVLMAEPEKNEKSNWRLYS